MTLRYPPLYIIQVHILCFFIHFLDEYHMGISGSWIGILEKKMTMGQHQGFKITRECDKYLPVYVSHGITLQVYPKM